MQHVCIPLLNGLAKVPALSCRLGYVPYNRAFGALMGGYAPYDRAFGALIVHSLSITKKFTKEKLDPLGIEPVPFDQ